jgi:hypothetical protein
MSDNKIVSLVPSEEDDFSVEQFIKDSAERFHDCEDIIMIGVGGEHSLVLKTSTTVVYSNLVLDLAKDAVLGLVTGETEVAK